jgi:RNA polymerase sigma factor (sigma-70 family)
MPDRQLHGLLQHLRGIVAAADTADVSDAQLLERFVNHRDEAAFGLLVGRHGRMVLGVCRRLLRDAHASEDAFQASFLALARRASSIGKRSSVGGWLYKVAYRVALEARARALRRAAREQPVYDVSVAAATPDPAAEAEQRELHSVIDDEVSRLPEKYRVPLVLCYFDGKSNTEAARDLGCPLGTVESRLTRARQRLRGRLAGRGLSPSAVGLSASVTSAEVPAPLAARTVTAAVRVAAGQAAGACPANVAALTEAVLKSMWTTKVRIAAAALAVGLLVGGAGLFTQLAAGEKRPEAAQASPKPAAARPPVAPDQSFETAPGYAWAIAPRDGRGTAWAVGWRPAPQAGLPANAGIAAFEETAKDGGLVIFLAHPPSTNGALPDYRPVAFDARRKRYPLRSDGAVSAGATALARYYLDPKALPADKVVHLGIEVLTPEGPKIVARLAAQRARKAGVQVPSFPEIGQAYDFALTTTDGRKIRARDLRGKVVLLDCWATWCSPCMALLPEIKGLYEKWHQDGLEVIGINFDHGADKAKKACARFGLPWPQVLVPDDETTRQLWQEAGGIGVLPRVLLIDREGILRADQPSQLDKAIAELLKRPAEKSREN